jgi:hypothetical protein
MQAGGALRRGRPQVAHRRVSEGEEATLGVRARPQRPCAGRRRAWVVGVLDRAAARAEQRVLSDRNALEEDDEVAIGGLDLDRRCRTE